MLPSLNVVDLFIYLFYFYGKHQKTIRLALQRFSQQRYYENNFEIITVLSMQPPCLCPSLGHKYGGHRIVQSVK